MAAWLTAFTANTARQSKRFRFSQTGAAYIQAYADFIVQKSIALLSTGTPRMCALPRRERHKKAAADSQPHEETPNRTCPNGARHRSRRACCRFWMGCTKEAGDGAAVEAMRLIRHD